MSKAFTRESDAAADEDIEAISPLPAGARNYMTPGGFARLAGELERLVKKERPELVATVAWAAGNGDRSENGDYIYGKKRLREIDRRIRFLIKRLDTARGYISWVSPMARALLKTRVGDTVTLRTPAGIEEIDIVDVRYAPLATGAAPAG